MMKNIFKAKNNLIIIVTLAIAILIATTLVTIFAGIERTTELAGGTRISISAETKKDANKAKDIADKFFDKKSVDIEKSYFESNGITYSVTYETTSKNIKDSTITALTKSMDEIDGIIVSEAEEFNSSFKEKTWAISLIAVAILLLSVIVSYVFFRNLWTALTTLAVSIFSMIVGACLMILCRIPLSSTVLLSVGVGTIIATVMSILLSTSANESSRHLSNKDKTREQIFSESVRTGIRRDSLIFGFIIVLCVIIFFVSTLSMKIFITSLIIEIVISIFSAYYFGVSFEVCIKDKVEQKMTEKMEIPETVIEKKLSKTKKSKQERPTSSKSIKSVKKKKRARRTSNGDSNKIVV